MAAPNPQLATHRLQLATNMNPLLAQIREQLPSEAVPFGLVVRGEVLEPELSAFTQLAQETQAATRKEPGNVFYFFFFSIGSWPKSGSSSSGRKRWNRRPQFALSRG
jgi:hypothetical protein